jgi:hypothetical protein
MFPVAVGPEFDAYGGSVLVFVSECYVHSFISRIKCNLTISPEQSFFPLLILPTPECCTTFSVTTSQSLGGSRYDRQAIVVVGRIPMLLRLAEISQYDIFSSQGTALRYAPRNGAIHATCIFNLTGNPKPNRRTPRLRESIRPCSEAAERLLRIRRTACTARSYFSDQLIVNWRLSGPKEYASRLKYDHDSLHGTCAAGLFLFPISRLSQGGMRL